MSTLTSHLRMTKPGVNDPISLTPFNGNFDILDTAVYGKASKPTYATMTMASSGWNSSTNEYSFETSYPNASYDISISVAPTATSAQYDAFARAKICGSANTNVVKALGTKPSVNIPIIVKVVAK